jgi:hypothetical protein
MYASTIFHHPPLILILFLVIPILATPLTPALKRQTNPSTNRPKGPYFCGNLMVFLPGKHRTKVKVP